MKPHSLSVFFSEVEATFYLDNFYLSLRSVASTPHFLPMNLLGLHSVLFSHVVRLVNSKYKFFDAKALLSRSGLTPVIICLMPSMSYCSIF